MPIQVSFLVRRESLVWCGEGHDMPVLHYYYYYYYYLQLAISIHSHE